MSLEAYLTIDDTPSSGTGDLVDYLAGKNIPAMLFCRGDGLEDNQTSAIRAIETGAILANHSYSHRPAGDLSFEEVVEEIEKTERLIDECYRKAGRVRPGKYFRFAYIDRGDGDRLERRFDEIIDNPHALLPASEKVAKLQAYLKAQGFSQPFESVVHPLYKNSDVAGAADCLFTYSSCDWMLTPRHLGQWDYRTVDDLKRKMDNDPWLCKGQGPQVVLFHDQPEIGEYVTGLLDYMLEKGFAFLPFA